MRGGEAASRSPPDAPKTPLKTHSWFLPLKRSRNREFRAVQKSRYLEQNFVTESLLVLRETHERQHRTAARLRGLPFRRRYFQSQKLCDGVWRSKGSRASVRVFLSAAFDEFHRCVTGCCNEIDVAIADRGLSSCISVGNNRNFSKAKCASCDRPCALSNCLRGRFCDHRNILGSTLAAVPVDRARDCLCNYRRTLLWGRDRPDQLYSVNLRHTNIETGADMELQHISDPCYWCGLSGRSL